MKNGTPGFKKKEQLGKRIKVSLLSIGKVLNTMIQYKSPVIILTPQAKW
jgi:hypothetical protein